MASGRWSWRYSASPAPTRWRWSTGSRRCCPSSTAELGPTGSIHILNDRSASVRAAVHDVQLTLLVTVGFVDPGDLPVPRAAQLQPPSPPRRAGLHHRHLRRDAAARLLDRQHLAPGAHPVGRPGGRRRHRHAGEHRPAHRRGDAADAGCPQGQRRDRLHDRLDHGLAGGRVHPGPADGRGGRARVPRVRDGGDDRDRGLGFRLVDPDADALRPPPRSPGHGPASSATCSSVLSTTSTRPTAGALDLSLRARPFDAAACSSPPSAAHRLAIPRHSQGVLPAGGHRPALDPDRNAPGRFVPSHAGVAAGSRGGHPALAIRGSRGPPSSAAARRRCHHAQQWPFLRRAEAQGPTGAAGRRWWPTCAATGHIAGIGSFIVPVQNFSFGGRSSKSQYQFVVQGIDRDELYAWATRLGRSDGPRQRFRRRPRATCRTRRSRRRIVVDRDKARSLGITADQLRSTLYTGFGSRQAVDVYATGDNYAVIVEFDPRIPWSADRSG